MLEARALNLNSRDDRSQQIVEAHCFARTWIRNIIRQKTFIDPTFNPRELIWAHHLNVFYHKIYELRIKLKAPVYRNYPSIKAR